MINICSDNYTSFTLADNNFIRQPRSYLIYGFQRTPRLKKCKFRSSPHGMSLLPDLSSLPKHPESMFRQRKVFLFKTALVPFSGPAAMGVEGQLSASSVDGRSILVPLGCRLGELGLQKTRFPHKAVSYRTLRANHRYRESLWHYSENQFEICTIENRNFPIYYLFKGLE